MVDTKKPIHTEAIYQIYPLTFNYAEGSASDPHQGAYGNIKGITEKADYIKDLGMNAIWVCPFYGWAKTNGFGYDVTDYKNVDPMFGTNEDFKEMVDTYHDRGVKVYIDQVYNHYSIKSDWFQKSEAREEPYTDYFVWNDGKRDEQGNLMRDEAGRPLPPNNWPSKWDISGDSAWTWNEKREQYYLHSFDFKMANLNINNEKVREEIKDIAKLWFDRGVDGFRLDGASHYGYDDRFLDNPTDRNNEPMMRVYDIFSKEGTKFLDELQGLANSYNPPKSLLSECPLDDKGKYGARKGRLMIKKGQCDTFYIGSTNVPLDSFKESIKSAMDISPNGERLNWATSNHDMERVATRWFGQNPDQRDVRMAMDLLMSLPGSVCVYQGEELGLPNPKKREMGNDPLNLNAMGGDAPWDLSRTAMPFTFQKTKPSMWMEPTKAHRSVAVDVQEKDKGSNLNYFKNALKERQSHPILSKLGGLEMVETENDKVIAFVRSTEDKSKSVLCAFNFSDEEAKIKVPKELGGMGIIVPAHEKRRNVESSATPSNVMRMYQDKSPGKGY